MLKFNTGGVKQILEIAAELVPLETRLETITAPQNMLVFLLDPLMGLSPHESTHRIHRDTVSCQLACKT